MTKVREIVYMILDEVKNVSDDAFFTESHILFLIDKYRALLFEQKYKDPRIEIPEIYYQVLCLNLEVNNSKGICGSARLRTIEKIPRLFSASKTEIYAGDYFSADFVFIDKIRMRHVGYNKFLDNIIYCAVGPDQRLYFKANNPQHYYLKQIKVRGVFADYDLANQLSCDVQDTPCDIMDADFLLEDELIPRLIEVCVKEILSAAYRPMDNLNNANDELSKVGNTELPQQSQQQQVQPHQPQVLYPSPQLMSQQTE